MFELLTDPLLRTAALQSGVIAAVCGPLGVWVLHQRQAFAAESLSHAMLPGLVVAAIAGLPLFVGGLGGILVAAIVVGAAARDRRTGPDTAVAIVVSGLLGLGIILALRPAVPPRLAEVLFGDPLAAATADVILAGAMGAVLLVVLVVANRSLQVATFDAVAAPSLGTNPQRMRAVLLIVLAAAIALAARGLGNLLLVALLIAPAAVALRASSRLSTQLWLAAAVGVASVLVGLEASLLLTVAAGPAIAVAACAAYLVAAVPRRGMSGGASRRSPIETLTR